MDFWQLIRDYPVVVPGVVGVTAIIGALWAVVAHRAAARRKTTIEMLTAKLWDDKYFSAAHTFHRLLRDPMKLTIACERVLTARKLKESGQWAALGKAERKAFERAIARIDCVRTMLDDRDLLAIGIREGVYDERIVRDWWSRMLIAEWQKASWFIVRLRSDGAFGDAPDAFSAFEALADRLRSTPALDGTPNRLPARITPIVPRR